jgi:hypothetical protein
VGGCGEVIEMSLSISICISPLIEVEGLANISHSLILLYAEAAGCPTEV